jgi:hypothetical protein
VKKEARCNKRCHEEEEGECAEEECAEDSAVECEGEVSEEDFVAVDFVAVRQRFVPVHLDQAELLSEELALPA